MVKKHTIDSKRSTLNRFGLIMRMYRKYYTIISVWPILILSQWPNDDISFLFFFPFLFLSSETNEKRPLRIIININVDVIVVMSVNDIKYAQHVRGE